MHCRIARERHCEVEAKGKVVIAFCEAVYLLFGFAARLCEQYLGKLYCRRVDGEKAVFFIYASDLVVNAVKKYLFLG